MNDAIKGRCWQCGNDLQSGDYGRETNCRECGKPTRVCRNCRWYAPGRPNQCQEPMAEPVMEKEKPNFCGFFEPTPEVMMDEDATSTDAMRQAAEDLFKL